VSELRQRLEAQLRHDLADGFSQPSRGQRSVAPLRTACMFEADHHRDPTAGELVELGSDSMRIELKRLQRASHRFVTG
jgi:hypothetical protein